ncbi:MAG TPA: tetratricopeptide repeat protein, partial [Candidatus Methylomirabilis sp.]
ALLLVLVRGAGVGRVGRGVVAAGVLAVAGGAWAVPSWDQRVLTSGPAVYAAVYVSSADRGAFRALAHSRELLFYEDGPGGTVSVHSDRHSLSLRINGKTDASNNANDMRTQLLSAHLPLFLHAAPRRVLVVGLGSGVTVGAALQHPLELVEVVEIEPAVVRAARFFARENRAALEDPRTRLVVADARHRLATTSDRFDVIIMEPSNPWIRGLATLFTPEYYGTVRQRLTPGGVVLQWVQGYGLGPGDFTMVIRTFRRIFPHATLWHTAGGDFLLVGGPEPLRLDLERVRPRLQASPGLQADFARLGLPGPAALLSDFLLGERDTARVAGEGPLNTDDMLPLEYSAPRSLYRATVPANLALLRGARTEGPAALAGDARILDDPRVRYEVALALLAKQVPGEALGHLETALQRDPGFLPARLARGRALLSLGQPFRAAADLEAAAGGPERHEATALLGQAYADLGEGAKAEAAFRRALALRPDVDTYLALGRLHSAEGRAAEAQEDYGAALRLAPQHPGALLGIGTALLALGRAREAIAPLQAAANLDSLNARPFLALGRAQALAGRSREAESTLRLALVLDPGLVAAYLELSGLYRGRGTLEPAIAVLRRGLELRPGDPAMSARLADLEAGRRGPQRDGMSK